MAAKAKKEKLESLDLVLGAIHKKFGNESIFLSNSPSVKGIQKTSSGFITVDRCLGGGFGYGRIVEVYGDASVGKTTICLHLISQVMKDDPEAICAFVDAEHALDLEYARALGVDLDRLLISQPDNGEQALEIVDMLIRSHKTKVIVVDSVAALVPQVELEGEMSDASVGAQARLLSKALRKITSILGKSGTILMFTNQLRANIGVMGYGPKSTTSGGNALKFYASLRIEMKRTGAEKQGEEVIGNRTQIKVVKNKLAPPFKTTEVVITFGRGINKEQEVIDLGVKYGVVNKGGAWYSYKEGKWQGTANFLEALYSNQKLFQEIKDEIIKKMEDEEPVIEEEDPLGGINPETGEVDE